MEAINSWYPESEKRTKVIVDKNGYIESLDGYRQIPSSIDFENITFESKYQTQYIGNYTTTSATDRHA